MARFEVGGHEYVSDRIDARTQFHVSRRLAPVLPSFKALLSAGGSGDLLDLGNNLEAAQPLIEAISKMRDEDVDYVFDAVLKKTRRAVKGPTGEVTGWTPVWNDISNRPQFEDMEMSELLTITYNVLWESLQRFFSESLSSSTE